MRTKIYDFEDKILKKNPQILILLLGQSNVQVSFSTVHLGKTKRLQKIALCGANSSFTIAARVSPPTLNHRRRRRVWFKRKMVSLAHFLVE